MTIIEMGRYIVIRRIGTQITGVIHQVIDTQWQEGAVPVLELAIGDGDIVGESVLGGETGGVGQAGPTYHPQKAKEPKVFFHDITL